MCAVAVISSYTFLPILLESLVASSVQKSLGLAEAPEVDLASDPALNVFLGKFEEGRVRFESTEPASETTVGLDPFDLDVFRSLASGRISSEEPLSGVLRAELSEEEVASIAASYAVAPVRYVELEEGRVAVGSEAEVLGLGVPVGVEGEVDVENGVLRFEPSQLRVFGEPLPSRLERRLLQETDFSYSLGELMGGADVTGVEVHEDRLVFTGEVTLPAS